MDYTISTYRRLLDGLKQIGVPIYGVAEWLKNSPTEGLLLRHDVDRRPQNALRMAQEEAQQGVRSTYYFRVIGSANCSSTMQEISRLGHEVGYHYEDYSRAKGNFRDALLQFNKNLENLRRIVPISTIAMHGSPISRFNNLALGKVINMHQHQLLGDAILSINYSEMLYLTDTGRTWQLNQKNIRDRPENPKTEESEIRSTDDLIGYIRSVKPRRLAVSVHPERWNSGVFTWSRQWIFDSAANGIKALISRINHGH